MKTYLLTYQMTPWFNYSAFYEKLKQKFAEHRHIVENSWIIRTNCTAVDIISELKPFMNFEQKNRITQDQIFCFELKDGFDYAGYGATSTHEYIKIEQK